MSTIYGGTVTVSTATVNANLSSGNTPLLSGATVTHNYTGDGHVVGTVQGGNLVPTTLGTTGAGGAFDGFLDTEGSAMIDISFSGSFTSISFDYEIFPSAAGGTPDFTFIGYNNTTLVYRSATTVATSPVGGKSCAGTAGTGSTANNAAGCAGTGLTETNPQLGPQTMTINFGSAVNHIQFVDWPDTIGIDNIQINPPGGQAAGVPEPASMVLLGSGLVGVALRLRRKIARKAA